MPRPAPGESELVAYFSGVEGSCAPVSLFQLAVIKTIGAMLLLTITGILH